MRILVAEDHPDLLDVTREVLQNEGHQVTAVADGLSAKELLESGVIFDLVITDVNMPRLGGRELTLWIKTCDRTEIRGLKVIMATGHSDMKSRLADAILIKPFSIQALVETVNKVAPQSRFFAANPDDNPALKRANAKIVDIAGRKKRIDTSLADEILTAYYKEMGYADDYRGQGLLSPDGNRKVVLKGRNIQTFSGGRGKWAKQRSISKIEAAETLLAKAREDLGIRIAGKSALEDLKDHRQAKAEKKKVKLKKSELEKLAKLATLVHVSQELTPNEKLAAIGEALDLMEQFDQYYPQYLETIPEDADPKALRQQIQKQCSVKNPPVVLLEEGYEYVEWEEDGFPISLKRVPQGIVIQIGSTFHPIDPFGMRVMHSLMAGDGDSEGYISGAIHTSRERVPVPALFMITSKEKQKGAGTRMLRLFCNLVRGLGFSSFVAEGVGSEGQQFFSQLEKKGHIDILGRGANWIIRCSNISEDPAQMRLFPQG